MPKPGEPSPWRGACAGKFGGCCRVKSCDRRRGARGRGAIRSSAPRYSIVLSAPRLRRPCAKAQPGKSVVTLETIIIVWLPLSLGERGFPVKILSL